MRLCDRETRQTSRQVSIMCAAEDTIQIDASAFLRAGQIIWQSDWLQSLKGFTKTKEIYLYWLSIGARPSHMKRVKHSVSVRLKISGNESTCSLLTLAGEIHDTRAPYPRLLLFQFQIPHKNKEKKYSKKKSICFEFSIVALLLLSSNKLKRVAVYVKWIWGIYAKKNIFALLRFIPPCTWCANSVTMAVKQ